MNRLMCAVLFATGLAAVGWIGVGFADTNGLALLMTLVTGAVFALGSWEVWRFSGVSVALAAALARLPQPMTDLSSWVRTLPLAVQQPVRSRIEGERTALPGLALTPYLVGLLVMLGMLGTFLGMVITFKGAVFALEGSTDLQTIRSALAAPIKGLGLSFGTSVAGVATSALLGLMSALCRRERMGVVRELDARMVTVFRPFTLAHQRAEAFQALQLQARTLPDVVDTLHTIVQQMDSRHQLMNEQMLARQSQFHAEVSVAYADLAQSVSHSLATSLATSARMASEGLQPVVENTLTRMAADARLMHQQLRDTAEQHVQGLSAQFAHSATQVASTWAAALTQQTQTHDALVDRLDGSLARFNASFDARANAWLAESAQAAVATQQAQQAADQARQAAWSQSLASVTDSLQQAWQRAAAQTHQQAGQHMDRAATLLLASEELVRTRVDAEARWAQQQDERMTQLTALWHTSLDALRADETQRSQAAVDRLGALQTALASQLATLGAALEAPMTRLMHTASEVPQAAASMLAELRHDMTRLTERDNLAFDERRHIVSQTAALLDTFHQAADQQRAAVDALVASANVVLDQASERFARTLAAQVDKTDDTAAHVNATAMELASLGEAFNHGVQLFSAANEKLVEGLQRIEGAMKQATARSDDQLAYYVAQAREVIDLSIASQQGIVDDLRRLRALPAHAELETAA